MKSSERIDVQTFTQEVQHCRTKKNGTALILNRVNKLPVIPIRKARMLNKLKGNHGDC